MMKPKAVIRIVLDVLMTLALLFLMGYQFWGEEAHEWAGVGIFILFIAHHILNIAWYRTLFKGKYSAGRIFQLCINTLTLIAMLALMYSSIVLSRYAFRFLNIEGGMALARKLHILGSYWSMVLMSLHLGMHWSMILTMARNHMPPAKHKRLLSGACFCIGMVIAAYGVHVFIARDYPTYLFLQSEFVFFDYEESRILYYFDYLSLMGLFVFLSHYLSKGFTWFRKRSGKAEKERFSMKRMLSFLLSLCMLLCLTACGGGQPEATGDAVNTPTEPPTSPVSQEASATQAPAAGTPGPVLGGGSNILIAYFTWAENTIVENPKEVDVDATTSASVLIPGNTAKMANWIREYVGGDLFSIVVSEPYSSDYDECLDRAADEKAADTRPELVHHVDSMEQYDTIFLGFPNWWYTAPMAIFSFIEEYDLSGKTIVPFCAHGTGGLASSIRDITAALPESAEVLEAIGVYRPDIDAAQPVIHEWLESLGFVQLGADEPENPTPRRLTMTIGEQSVPITLLDTPAANSLYEMLPLTLTFEDYNGIEKISYLTESLNTEGEPDGCDPAAGDVCLYAPWGNLSIFYNDFRYSDGLILLGRMDAGIDVISELDGDFTATLTVAG